jgi:hypothetical protein
MTLQANISNLHIFLDYKVGDNIREYDSIRKELVALPDVMDAKVKTLMTYIDGVLEENHVAGGVAGAEKCDVKGEGSKKRKLQSKRQSLRR